MCSYEYNYKNGCGSLVINFYCIYLKDILKIIKKERLEDFNYFKLKEIVYKKSNKSSCSFIRDIEKLDLDCYGNMKFTLKELNEYNLPYNTECFRYCVNLLYQQKVTIIKPYVYGYAPDSNLELKDYHTHEYYESATKHIYTGYGNDKLLKAVEKYISTVDLIKLVDIMTKYECTNNIYYPKVYKKKPSTYRSRFMCDKNEKTILSNLIKTFNS